MFRRLMVHSALALAMLAPEERIHTDPGTAPPDDIEALLAFKLAPGITPRFPRLKFVACAGAGVDELLATPDLPPHVPVVRAVDPGAPVSGSQRWARCSTMRARR